MSWIEICLWCLVAVIGVIGAGVGAGLETGVYSLNRIQLRVRQHQGYSTARLLAKQLIAPAALIAALLLVHNAGVFTATHATAMLLSNKQLTEWQIVAFDVLIILPLLFVFAETVPKDLFSIHADRLLYTFARPMAAIMWLCRYSGVLPLIMGTTHILMWTLGLRSSTEPIHPRHEIQTLVRESVGHGVLSDEQMAIVERVLALGGRRVADVMTPWEKVVKVHIHERPTVLWELTSKTTHSGFPVVDRKGRVHGMINVFDALVHTKDQCPPIESLIIPAGTFPQDIPLREALAQLQERRVTMALVTDHRTRPVGLVTIKDLIEPITGELAEW